MNAAHWDLGNRVRATAAPRRIANSQVVVIVVPGDWTPLPAMGETEQATQVPIVEPAETVLGIEARPAAQALGAPAPSAAGRGDPVEVVRVPAVRGARRACAVEVDAVEAGADEGKAGSG